MHPEEEEPQKQSLFASIFKSAPQQSKQNNRKKQFKSAHSPDGKELRTGATEDRRKQKKAMKLRQARGLAAGTAGSVIGRQVHAGGGASYDNNDEDDDLASTFSSSVRVSDEANDEAWAKEKEGELKEFVEEAYKGISGGRG